MSYQTYTTEAIVCGSYTRHTSDKTYLLFTQIAGMIYATARSVREERSRQRYALQDFSLVRISLVQGRGGWRIGSVASMTNFYYSTETRVARGGVCDLIRFLRQFLRGEVADPVLFEDSITALTRVSSCATGEVVTSLIDRFKLRALYTLGYIQNDTVYDDILTESHWSTHTAAVPERAKHAIAVAYEMSQL